MQLRACTPASVSWKSAFHAESFLVFYLLLNDLNNPRQANVRDGRRPAASTRTSLADKMLL